MNLKNDYTQAKILIVDDEQITLHLIKSVLRDLFDIDARICNDSRRVLDLVKEENFDLIFLDLHMPWLSGDSLLEKLNAIHPDMPIIILTSEDNVETAVRCMKLGAFDFMTKPIHKTRIATSVHNALSIYDLKKEVQALSFGPLPEPKNKAAFTQFITKSPRMLSIFSYIEAVAPSPKTILITGESGTGKELVARSIHNLSGRSGPFVPINVSGLDESMFSDSLFGHIKGAYTGAESQRRGLIEHARDGTLFLDEIGDLDQNAQIKLLRLLQEGEYYPIGSDKPQKSFARVIAATNADLTSEHTKFRKDLYFRLISHRLSLPPLRERREDVRGLTLNFVKEACVTLNKPELSIDEYCLRALERYDFPGNIRELQALVVDAVSRAIDDTLTIEHFASIKMSKEGYAELRQEILAQEPAKGESELMRGPGDLFLGNVLPAVDEVLDFLYTIALDRCHGKQQEAAKMLGVSQPTLSRWLAKQNNRGDQR